MNLINASEWYNDDSETLRERSLCSIVFCVDSDYDEDDVVAFIRNVQTNAIQWAASVAKAKENTGHSPIGVREAILEEAKKLGL